MFNQFEINFFLVTCLNINNTVGSGDDSPLAALMNIVNVRKHKIDGFIFIGGHCQ